MKSFNEWYETIDDCAFDDMICAMGSAFEAGQQSKQDEVDVLRKRINSVEKLISTWDSELDELRRCGDRNAHCLSVCIVELIESLKGKSNED